MTQWTGRSGLGQDHGEDDGMHVVLFWQDRERSRFGPEPFWGEAFSHAFCVPALRLACEAIGAKHVMLPAKKGGIGEKTNHAGMWGENRSAEVCRSLSRKLSIARAETRVNSSLAHAGRPRLVSGLQFRYSQQEEQGCRLIRPRLTQQLQCSRTTAPMVFQNSPASQGSVSLLANMRQSDFGRVDAWYQTRIQQSSVVVAWLLMDTLVSFSQSPLVFGAIPCLQNKVLSSQIIDFFSRRSLRSLHLLDDARWLLKLVCCLTDAVLAL